MADPWREAGALALLGVLFAAALPSLRPDDVTWRATLVVEVGLAVLLAVASLVLARRPGSPRLLWIEPLGALVVTGLALLLVQWDAGADAERVGVGGWAHAVVAVVTYLAVATGVAVVGILRDRNHLTVTALAALVVFIAFQSFAVFAQIIEGAWLFLTVGLVLAGSGYLADRGRRQLASSLDDLGEGAKGDVR